MKFKHVIYGFVILAAGFAAVMALFVLYYRPTLEFGPSRTEAVGVTSSPVRDQGKTVSGKAGKAVIAYAGDIEGSLDPCG